MKLRVRREAEHDVLESATWYNEAEVGLGDAFVTAIQNAYSRIERGPLHYQTIYGDVRMARTQRFLHGVFFLAREHEAIVLAVLHLHRAPGTWKKRLRNLR